jgi:hypothetical protein
MTTESKKNKKSPFQYMKTGNMPKISSHLALSSSFGFLAAQSGTEAHFSTSPNINNGEEILWDNGPTQP